MSSILFLIVGCFNGNDNNDNTSDVPIVTKQEQLDRYIDKKITIRGTVTNRKIPTIMGVDIRSNNPDLRGEQAEATGILRKWTVTEEELEQQREASGATANRGPGTFYRLEALDEEGLAQVRPVDD